MSRRCLAWLLVFALTVAGWITAHEVAYRLLVPHPQAPTSDLAHARHAYLAYASFIVVLCLLVAILCTAGLIAEAPRSRPLSGRFLALLALLPPLAFALQEVTESLLTTGVLPTEVATEPTFAVGMLLQVPFALAALVVARTLFAVARSLARRITDAGRPRLASLDLSLPPVADIFPPRLHALAFGCGERGPPHGAAA